MLKVTCLGATQTVTGSNFLPKVYLIHGEEKASNSLARAIQKKLGLEVHIPLWKERLVLKPRQEAEEILTAETPEMDVSTAMLNTLVDVEGVIRNLRKQLQNKEGAEGVDEDDLERLQAMYQELRTMLEQ